MARVWHMIRVIFFARLREQLGCGQLDVELAQPATVASLLEQLLLDHPQWQSAFANDNMLVAVNQVMASHQTPVGNAAEVAFFPPVTGG